MAESYYRYWGKEEKDGQGYHLLPYHCLDVAAVGHVLLLKNAALSLFVVFIEAPVETRSDR